MSFCVDFSRDLFPLFVVDVNHIVILKNMIFLVKGRFDNVIKDSLKTYLIAVSFVLLRDSHLDDVNLFKLIALAFSLNCIIQIIRIE